MQCICTIVYARSIWNEVHYVCLEAFRCHSYNTNFCSVVTYYSYPTCSNVRAGSIDLWLPTFTLVRNILQDEFQGGDICKSPLACKATDFTLIYTLQLCIYNVPFHWLQEASDQDNLYQHLFP